MNINNFYIFIILFLCQYLFDRLTNNCESIKGEIYLFIHHIISIYVIVGGILFNPLYHLILLIIILVHWLTNKDVCIISKITNNYCKFKETPKFRDIFYFADISKKTLYVLLIIVILYDLYKIFYK